MKTQLYVGIQSNLKRDVFRSSNEPTRESHGHLYLACIGPFRTKQGAQFMADFGQGNPHCQTVYDAERLARLYGNPRLSPALQAIKSMRSTGAAIFP